MTEQTTLGRESVSQVHREAAELLGLLADADRLRVVAAVALGARTLGEVMAAGDLATRPAVRALGRLTRAGLMRDDADGYTLVLDRLQQVARAAAPPPDSDDHGAADPGAAAVLRTFLRDGRLVSIPTARGKRLVILDHVARVFEPGVRYDERTVSAMLRAFHDDYAAVRRHLVDEGFLDRSGGLYWRAGGSVEV